jgi:hypothetical protein
MSKIDDGGPAFPGAWHPDMGWSPHQTPFGMSLRDWFAGMALSGLISTLEYPDADMAFRCYALADAMIDAHKVKPEGDA